MAMRIAQCEVPVLRGKWDFPRGWAVSLYLGGKLTVIRSTVSKADAEAKALAYFMEHRAAAGPAGPAARQESLELGFL